MKKILEYAIISSKGDEDMVIKRAERTDLETVKRIVHETIRAVYPHQCQQLKRNWHLPRKKIK